MFRNERPNSSDIDARIVRISGPEAMDVLGRVFPRALKGLEPRKMTYGHIVDSDSGTVIDEVLACFLPGP